MKRVFYIECSGAIWRSIAAQCKSDAGWLPVMWTAEAADENAIVQEFPEALFIAGTDAALGLQHDRATWPLKPIALDTLSALALDETIGLHMMDRMDPACGLGFSHDARRRHWRGLLTWWNAAIDHLKPDLIVFSISPHVVFDYALLALARHLGIATCMFERLGLPGRVFVMADYVRGNESLRSAMQDKKYVSVDSVQGEFGAWLRDSLAGGGALPANFRKKLERYRLGQGIPSLTRAVFYELKRAWVLMRLYKGQPAANSYLRSAFPPHGRAGQLETLLARLKGVWFKRCLMKQHDAQARLPEVGEDFVFLALHYQPERATVPLGGLFGDQLLIVEWLTATLPNGWKLYVKEHPWQLQPYGRGEVERSAFFYELLCRNKNVVLVSREAVTGDLVRRARAVATVTGSVGWDALCAGVPTLIFGAAWYRDCPGVYEVRNHDGLKAEFDRIIKGERPTPEGVAAFCQALSEICVPGVLEPNVEAIVNIDYGKVSRNMASALMKFAEHTN